MKRMMLKQGLLWMAMVCVLTFCMVPVWAATTNLSTEEIHFNAIVVDTHNDTMMKVIDEVSWLPLVDLGGNTPADFQLDLQKAGKGGLDVAFYAAYTDYRVDALHTSARTNSRSLALINALHWNVDQNENMVLATNLREIEMGLEEGKHVALASLEGMYQFGTSNAIELLHQYYDLGIRAAGIVWNTPNSLGSGTIVHNNAPDAGLTEIGKAVIRRMNQLGIVVDVSHMNETTFFDTMAIVKAPVMASHSGVDGVRPHVRNLSDEQLLAIKENGGVVQINFWSTTVADIGQEANISRLADHVDYVVQLIGVDHVGLGSDFDGAPMPVDLPDASYLPNLTAELVDRGYSQEELEKILGGNALRVLQAVEEYAVKPPQSIGRGFGLSIIPNLVMGEITSETMPLLTARVIGHGGSFVDPADFKVIVDGVVYEPVFEASTGVLSLQMPTELIGQGVIPDSGNFHVVTFEGSNRFGAFARETVIFYIR